MYPSSHSNVCILGSTGSIGTQTLDVIAQHPEQFSIYALSAHSNTDLLVQQCKQFRPQYAVISDESRYSETHAALQQQQCQTELLCGEQALSDIASSGDVDKVVAAIVGGAGLPSIHAAVSTGKQVLLANKESLVMTGNLLLEKAQQCGASIIPLDSEHNALFQCLPVAQGFREKTLAEAGVSKLLLTASGGPFRQTALDELATKTPDQACKHPNWSMGRKISVDSATMMNKGLEYIEAKLLFAANDNQLDVIIHPQSIIHSMVQYQDGTSLAQIGHSDMRVPIAHALSYPNRITSGVADIDLSQFTLSFEPVDYQRFPCLSLAMSVANDNAQATILNAANEIAVEAFLDKRIGFMQIADVVTQSLEKIPSSSVTSVEDVLALDAKARNNAQQWINTL